MALLAGQVSLVRCCFSQCLHCHLVPGLAVPVVSLSWPPRLLCGGFHGGPERFLCFLSSSMTIVFLLVPSPCRCLCCFLTTSCCQTIFTAFPRSRFFSSCRLSDSLVSLVPTTRRSHMSCSFISPYSQLVARVCRVRMYCSALSPGSCILRLKHALSKITFWRTPKKLLKLSSTFV